MYKASFKSLLARKLRLLMSAVAIMLGVAFVAGTLIFTGMLKSTFDDIMRGTVADVNVVVKGTYDPQSMDMSQVSSTAMVLTPADLEKIRAVPGVQQAEGVVSMTEVFPIGSDGKVLNVGGAPGIASNWLTAPALGNTPGVTLKEGREPRTTDEVVVDPKTLERSGYRIGDRMKFVSSAAGSFTKTIVGTASWGSGGSAGAMYSFFTDAEAQRLFLGGKKVFQTGWVSLEPGKDPVAMSAEVGTVVPQGYEAVDGQKAADATASVVNQGLSFIDTFLLVFAAIALVVASFLIVNTFSILVAQRSRELALFRAMGASRGQVRNTVLLEALVIGLVGATIGLFVGWLLAIGIVQLFGQMGMDFGGKVPRPGWNAILASYLIGTLVTLVAAWMPARAASKVPPVTAMTGALSNTDKGLGRRIWFGVALGLAGALAMVSGLWWLDDDRALVVGVGAAAVLLGVAAASPWMGRPVTWLLGRAYRSAFGEVGKLAELNATRQPRRTAATASALMLSLALVSALSVLGSSASSSLRTAISEGLRGDLMVESATFGNFPHSIAEQTQKIDGVQKVNILRGGMVIRDGQRTWLAVQDPASFNRMLAQELVAGRQATGMNETVLNRDAAEEWGKKVGDVVTVIGGDRKPTPLKVVGLFTDAEGGSMGNLVVNQKTGAKFVPPNQDQLLSVELAPGADLKRVHGEMDKFTDELPMVRVMDAQELIENRSSQVNQLLNVIYGLLGLAVVISILGIVNTLGLSVVERTREIGLLRAIALTRGQLRAMITLESVVIALLGSILGISLGVVFGAALQRVLADSGLSTLAIPWGRLLLFLAVAALVGVLAAVWPARRAARLNVLDAIAQE
ncbi:MULTISPECIES: ABC transporter permease [unclassified Luteococcus]|uniref:ABC transporter permease n=1 Tax=unclassified Luteococcus TaxID=2639923 RepID=UPI00313CF31E